MIVSHRRASALCLLLVTVVPLRAFAQSLVGTVYDASGAAIPAVTCEAESAALIEHVRTVVTDGKGQYRIEDLRPGTYIITFTRSGFRPHIEEHVQISSAFTVSIDVRLEPGPVE